MSKLGSELLSFAQREIEIYAVVKDNVTYPKQTSYVFLLYYFEENGWVVHQATYFQNPAPFVLFSARPDESMKTNC